MLALCRVTTVLFGLFELVAAVVIAAVVVVIITGSTELYSLTSENLSRLVRSPIELESRRLRFKIEPEKQMFKSYFKTCPTVQVKLNQSILDETDKTVNNLSDEIELGPRAKERAAK